MVIGVDDSDQSYAVWICDPIERVEIPYTNDVAKIHRKPPTHKTGVEEAGSCTIPCLRK